MQTANSFICIFSDAFSATGNWNKSRNHEKVDRKNRLFIKGHHTLLQWSYVVAPEHLCRLLTDKNIWVSPTDKWLILLLWSHCIAPNTDNPPLTFNRRNDSTPARSMITCKCFSLSQLHYCRVCWLCVAAYRPRPHLTLTPGWPRERAVCRLTGSWVVSSSYEAYSGKNILTMFLTKTLKLIETETC